MAVDSFRAPGNGCGGRDGFRLTGGLAKPNAVLEQMWNIAEIGVGGFTYFGKLPSEELGAHGANCHLRNFFQRIDADNPSNTT
jgi:hypothetical protein